jgi:hypothetical protein
MLPMSRADESWCYDVQLDQRDDGSDIQSELGKKTGGTSVPRVFINQKVSIVVVAHMHLPCLDRSHACWDGDASQRVSIACDSWTSHLHVQFIGGGDDTERLKQSGELAKLVEGI